MCQMVSVIHNFLYHLAVIQPVFGAKFMRRNVKDLVSMLGLKG